MQLTRFLISTFVCQLMAISCAIAEDFQASIPVLPLHSYYDEQNQPSGGFVELIRAMDKAYTSGTITIELYPFPRSINNVVYGRADFHLPLIENPLIAEETLPYAYSSEKITDVAFVSYFRDPSYIESSNNINYESLRVATVRGHKTFFPFEVIEVTTIESGIHLLQLNRIDAFIMEQEAVDNYIRTHQVIDIYRALYNHWASKFVIPKDPEQRQKVDHFLTDVLSRLKKDGTLDAIVSQIHQPYQQWQPKELLQYQED